MRTKKYQVFMILFLAGMLSVHLAIAWNSVELIRKGYPDFTIFYSSARILAQGLGRQLYDEPTQYRVQQQFAAGVSIRQGPLPYNHPPFEALAFVPFTWMRYPVAYLVWNLLNLIFLAMTLLVLRLALPGLRSVSVAAWLFVWVAFFPVFFALLQGQDVLFLVLLFTGVYVLLRRNSDIAAGCCLALGLFRFHLVLPLVLILLWQKRTKAIFGFFATAAVLAVISIAIVGWQGALAYPGQVWQMERTMEQHQTIFPLRMANVRGLLATLLPFASRLASNLVIGALSLALLLFAAHKWKMASLAEFDLGFSLCVIVTVLVSYHTLAYDLSLLILPVTLTIQHLFKIDDSKNEDSQPRTRLFLLVPLFLLFFSPLHAFLAMRDGHYNLFALVLLFWCWALSREIGGRREILKLGS
jgi:Glycosyltransferase family 87